MQVLREQRQYAVAAAAERERAAWKAFEQAARRDLEDEATIRPYRERWQIAARALVEALRALKT
ncbi:MAG: hypothetical protein ACJ74L_11640 [Gaiellaceae bacterium]